MIDANELRRKNYVYYGPDNELACVSQITKDLIGFMCGDSDSCDQINPIPLTEEILLKCGFERCNENRYKFYIHGVNYISLHLDYLIEKNEWFEGSFSVSFREKSLSPNFEGSNLCYRYLHQLQNLYFALTGKELEINL